MFLRTKRQIMKADNIATRIEAFKGVNVMIVGDIMTDRYINGNIHRLSPEAPVPVVDVETTHDRLGGAANVALNIKKLGGTPILLSVIGDDEEGHKLLKQLTANEIYTPGIIFDKDRKTTVKTRVISQNKQLLRFDNESRQNLNEQMSIAIMDLFVELVEDNEPKAVVFQDYDKGVLGKAVIEYMMKVCKTHKIPTAVDPKFDNFFDYKGCTLFKPNLKEASTCLKTDLHNANDQVLGDTLLFLASELNARCVILTLSEKGMMVYDGSEIVHLPAYKRNIADVSGAGDTVISILTMGMALNNNVQATAELANIGGGLVCEKVGVEPIYASELLAESLRILSE